MGSSLVFQHRNFDVEIQDLTPFNSLENMNDILSTSIDISKATWLQLVQYCCARDDVVFLDSGSDINGYGRYSYLCFDPFMKIQQWPDCLRTWHIEEGEWRARETSLAVLLNEVLREHMVEGAEGGCVPQGGMFGYMSYDYGLGLHGIPPHPTQDFPWPLAEFNLYDTVIVYDALRETAQSVATGLSETRTQQQWEAVFLASRDASLSDAGYVEGNCFSDRSCTFSANEYVDAVGRIKRYIAAGDTYQVNLSSRFYGSVPPEVSGYDFYENIRLRSPVPYGAYMCFEDRQIMSFSMELLLKVSGRDIVTRPIKGTIRRGSTEKEDQRQAQALFYSEKDRAELVMIVDMLRNDLGTICDVGSIDVSVLYEVEPYATVFHLVSTIQGRLRQGISSVDALHSLLPGGSVTGAPKKRTMEIIRQLEPTARGVYCGALGYIGFNGCSQFSLPIRTIMRQGTKVCVPSGAGITFGSDAQAEYDEVCDKIAFLLKREAYQG